MNGTMLQPILKDYSVGHQPDKYRRYRKWCVKAKKRCSFCSPREVQNWKAIQWGFTLTHWLKFAFQYWLFLLRQNNGAILLYLLPTKKIKALHARSLPPSLIPRADVCLFILYASHVYVATLNSSGPCSAEFRALQLWHHAMQPEGHWV